MASFETADDVPNSWTLGDLDNCCVQGLGFPAQGAKSSGFPETATISVRAHGLRAQAADLV